MAHLNTVMNVFREKSFRPASNTPAQASNNAPTTRNAASIPKGALRGAYDAIKMPPMITSASAPVLSQPIGGYVRTVPVWTLIDTHCVATRVMMINVATCMSPVIPAV